MKENWTYKKLGEVVSITMGQSPSSDTYNDSVGLPFFQGNADFGKEHPNVRLFCNAPIRIADVDDILISVRAPIGAINVADRKCCIGRGLASLRGNANCHNRFILHFLKANKDKLISQGTGSTFKSIGKDALYNLLIPVPSLPEQKRIVSELDLLQSIIDKQQAQLKELDKLAQAVFYDMFGDPMENEKGWEVKKLGEVACFKNGLNYSLNETGEKYYIIGVSDFHSKSEISCDSGLSTIYTNGTIDNGYILQDNDILFVRSNGNKQLIARNILVKTNKLDVTFSGFCIRARIVNDTVSPLFVNFLLKLPSSHKALTMKGRGCNISNLNQTTLNDFPIILPPLSLQQSFAEKIESIEKQKSAISQSIAETQKLFNYTMDKYFG